MDDKKLSAAHDTDQKKELVVRELTVEEKNLQMIDNIQKDIKMISAKIKHLKKFKTLQKEENMKELVSNRIRTLKNTKDEGVLVISELEFEIAYAKTNIPN